MAQRTVHYLFGELFSQQIEIKDKQRFLLGNVLPDAYAKGSDRDRTHFIVKTDTQVYFDFSKFRDEYADLICSDDLYLGYYMHLVEDAFYRQFLYSDRVIRPSNPEEVAMLHNDYHILNSHIVNNYHLQNELIDPIDLEAEAIGNIAEFRVNGFLEDMSGDFMDQTTGTTRFLTEDLLGEFIDKYVPLGLMELQCVQNGSTMLQSIDFAWQR